VGVRGHSINEVWYISKLVCEYIACNKRNIGQLRQRWRDKHSSRWASQKMASTLLLWY